MEPEVVGMSKPQKIAFGVVFALFVVTTLSSFYFYKELAAFKQNPQKQAEEEVKSLVAQVSELIVLPQNETPTVATVTDPDRLKDQPFFANALAGYKVLIYTNAKKAILYDPTTNKIIEVAPLVIGNQTAPESATN